MANNTINEIVVNGNTYGIGPEDLDVVRSRTITNLLDAKLSTTTISGITCTNNGDGTYTLNGTSTASEPIRLDLTDNTTIETGKKYRLVGCPSNGSGTTYKISVYGETVATYVGADFGDGFDFTASRNSCDVSIVIYPNATVNNLIFKPMLTTDLTATYDDYVQYSGDGELNENVAQLKQHLTDNGKEFKFGYENGQYGYYKQEGGADTFSPFSKYKGVITSSYSSSGTGASFAKSFDTSLFETSNVNSNTISVTMKKSESLNIETQILCRGGTPTLVVKKNNVNVWSGSTNASFNVNVSANDVITVVTSVTANSYVSGSCIIS